MRSKFSLKKVTARRPSVNLKKSDEAYEQRYMLARSVIFVKPFLKLQNVVKIHQG
jgi:hypothetical protein